MWQVLAICQLAAFHPAGDNMNGAYTYTDPATGKPVPAWANKVSRRLSDLYIF
jgi:hypothetical protein